MVCEPRPPATVVRQGRLTDRRGVLPAPMRDRNRKNGGYRPLITAASLKTQSWKELAELAKRHGLPGWRSMGKDELVQALLRAAKRPSATRSATKTNGNAKASAGKAAGTRRPGSSQKPAAAVSRSATKSASASATSAARKTTHRSNGSRHGTAQASPPAAKTSARTSRSAASRSAASTPAERSEAMVPSAVAGAASLTAAKPALAGSKTAVAEQLQRLRLQRGRLKDLSACFTLQPGSAERKTPEKDRLVLLVRDPYWLQVTWSVTRQSVRRAEAALAEHWHTAVPILRLLEVESGQTTSTTERLVREIEVHGGVTNWYIDVTHPPQSYRVELGYKAASGRFFSICRSNIVHTPPPDSGDVIDENWADVAENYERLYALSSGPGEERGSDLQELFEERLCRPVGQGAASALGGAQRLLHRQQELEFYVDAEMILYGRTKPDAKVTINGEPIKLRPDGSFTLRQPMPDRRQVLPLVASTPDGVEQRTIVIAVERNTKVLEPMVREMND